MSASPATDLAGRDNFYDTLEAGRIDDGVTVEDIRRNIAAGESFVINCTTSAGEDLVMWLGSSVLGVNYLIVKIVATAIVMVYNFVTRKIFLDGDTGAVLE